MLPVAAPQDAGTKAAEYSIELPLESREPGARHYVEAVAAASIPRVPLLMLGAKLSAPARIATLRDHALPGVPTEALPEPPSEMPPGQTAPFFRMKTEHREWAEHVLPAGQLEAFILGAPADLALNLVLILPTS